MRQLTLSVYVDEFGELTCTGKHEAADTFLNKLPEKIGCLTVSAAASVPGLIYDGWIPENEILFTVW